MKWRAAMIGLVITGSVLAAGPIGDRQLIEQRRIGQGIRSGSLTRPEAARLEERAANLHRDIVRDRRDGGGLTAAERARIHARQDALSRSISAQKHDGQQRIVR